MVSLVTNSIFASHRRGWLYHHVQITWEAAARTCYVSDSIVACVGKIDVQIAGQNALSNQCMIGRRLFPCQDSLRSRSPFWISSFPPIGGARNFAGAASSG